LVTNTIVVSLFAVLAAASGSACATGDAAAGKNESRACTSCHGFTGVSPNEGWPNLAAQKQDYLVKQLEAFREGSRTDPLMSPMAKPLSDADINNLAAYFSTQKAAPAAPVAPRGPADSIALPHVPVSPSDVVKVRPLPSRQYWADKMPEGEGRAVITQKCQLCHDLHRTLAFALPKQQWQNVVESMNRRGAPLTPEEIPVVVNYLTKYFGPDSPPIPAAGGVEEVGMQPCKRSEWPQGSSDFRSNWRGSYNIWVSNQQGGNIDIIDPVTKNIVRRINCVGAPDRIEFSRDGNTAYAPDRVEHNITVIDTRTGAIEAKVPLIERPNLAVLSRDYKKLFVGIWPLRSDEDTHGYVQVFDTDTLKVVKTIEVKGGIHDSRMSPDGKELLVMSQEGRFMSLLDTTTDKVIWTCCTEAEVGTMNMDAGPDGSTRWILLSYAEFSGVVVLDARTGQEVKRVPYRIPYPVESEAASKGLKLGFHGGEVSPDGRNYWVMQASFVYRYELPSFKPLGAIHLASIDQAGQPFKSASEGACLTISPDGQKVYAVRPARNLLSVIDVKTMKEEALIPTGEYPMHVAVWPRGTP
jgi:YVTN family beta-propeller protein